MFPRNEKKERGSSPKLYVYAIISQWRYKPMNSMSLLIVILLIIIILAVLGVLGDILEAIVIIAVFLILIYLVTGRKYWKI